MVIVTISDTHNQTPKLPDGDLLIHAGDLTMLGTKKEVQQSLEWLGSVRHKYSKGIILVPGNHDFLFEEYDADKRMATYKGGVKIERDPVQTTAWCKQHDITLLENSSVEIDGVKIYGSAFTPFFHNWAFNKYAHEMYENWQTIPDDTDILVSHTPPFGVGDLCPNGHVGCSNLLERLKVLDKLKLVVMGHIHEGAGVHYFNGKTLVNASVLDGKYVGFNPINVVEYPSMNIRRECEPS